MKKRRIKKEVKIILGVLAFGGCLLLANNIQEKQHQERLQEYKTCIVQQSEEQGYIIRYSCGGFSYEQYDRELGLEYKQVGYDLYLINK